MTYQNASDDPLDVIRANECEHPNTNDLSTARFRALWNEIERLRAALDDIAYMEVNMLDAQLVQYMRDIASKALMSSK